MQPSSELIQAQKAQAIVVLEGVKQLYTVHFPRILSDKMLSLQSDKLAQGFVMEIQKTISKNMTVIEELQNNLQNNVIAGSLQKMQKIAAEAELVLRMTNTIVNIGVKASGPTSPDEAERFRLRKQRNKITKPDALKALTEFIASAPAALAAPAESDAAAPAAAASGAVVTGRVRAGAVTAAPTPIRTPPPVPPVPATAPPPKAHPAGALTFSSRAGASAAAPATDSAAAAPAAQPASEGTSIGFANVDHALSLLEQQDVYLTRVSIEKATNIELDKINAQFKGNGPEASGAISSAQNALATKLELLVGSKDGQSPPLAKFMRQYSAAKEAIRAIFKKNFNRSSDTDYKDLTSEEKQALYKHAHAIKLDNQELANTYGITLELPAYVKLILEHPECKPKDVVDAHATSRPRR